MKTQEDIEKLAQQTHYESQNQGLNADGCFNQYQGFIKGYNQCQEDMSKELYEFGKLVLDTFHSEGSTRSGKTRLARIKFDEWFNSLNKQD